jgi:hypothetical protein
VEGGREVEVAVFDQATVGLAAEDGPGLAADHQQPAVGEPTQAGGLTWHLQLEADVTGLPGRVDGFAVEVRIPEALVVPTRALAESNPFDEGSGLRRGDVGHAILRFRADTPVAT